MRTRAAIIYLLFLSVDLTAILIALLVSASFAISPYVIPHSKYSLGNLDLQYLFLLLSFVWYFSTRSTGLYTDLRTKLYSIDIFTILKNIIYQVILLIIVLFIIKERALTRTFILVYGALATVLIFFGKIGVRFVLKMMKAQFTDANKVLIIGANELGGHVYEKLQHNSVGYTVVGYINDAADSMQHDKVLGTIADLERVISEKSVDMVIVALARADAEKLEQIISICRDHTVEVKIIPDVASYYLKNYKYTFLADIPVVSVSIDKLTEPFWRIVKRIFDIVFTIILSVTVFFWFIPILLLVQKIFNPGPILFKSERWGKGGKPFWIYKFRTMQPYEGEKIVPTAKDDPRVTKFGNILRKTSLDELPQFYNVLKGEMSIVGPRPFDKKEAVLMKEFLEKYMVRYYVRPGITGWAQINGHRGGTWDIEHMQKRIDIDNWYLHNWTIGLDVQIIFYTIVKLLSGDVNAY